MNKTLAAWIEASRPRTLPVSVAGVFAGTACAIFFDSFNPFTAICCLLFAIAAQIASNFANEYFDFKNGLDRKGREGFRRGVTEGDISPRAMKRATFITLLLSAIPGCALIYWGGWWLLTVGIIIAIFALAYSTGPYPLSHHGLGDIAVIIFFGLIPVGFTAWLQALRPDIIGMTSLVGCGVGMMAANVLIVNNYRDADDDARVGKNTTVVILGRRIMADFYILFSIAGLILLCAPVFFGHHWAIFPLILIPHSCSNWSYLRKHSGAELNILLKRTAIILLAACIILLAEACISIYY